MASYQYMTATVTNNEGKELRLTDLNPVNSREWVGLKFAWVKASLHADDASLVVTELAERTWHREPGITKYDEAIVALKDRDPRHGYMAWLDPAMVNRLVNGSMDIATDLAHKWPLEVSDPDDPEGSAWIREAGFPLGSAHTFLNGLGGRGWRPYPGQPVERLFDGGGLNREPVDLDLLFVRSSEDLPDDTLLDGLRVIVV